MDTKTDAPTAKNANRTAAPVRAAVRCPSSILAGNSLESGETFAKRGAYVFSPSPSGTFIAVKVDRAALG
eukprot:9548537-Ditylum_brightwellii.AAC.1